MIEAWFDQGGGEYSSEVTMILPDNCLYSSYSWSQQFFGKNVDDSWVVFLSHFNEVVSKTVPMRQEERWKTGRSG